MAHQTITARITGITRERSSRNGNPRWRIDYQTQDYRDHTATTGPDHSIGYAVGNPGKRAGDTVTLTINGRGWITDITSPVII